MEYFVLTFPKVFSTPIPQTTSVAWRSCPSHYCADAVVESTYCCTVIFQSLSSGAIDVWHSTDVTETHSCVVFTFYVFVEVNTFVSPKLQRCSLNLYFYISWPNVRLMNTLPNMHSVYRLVINKLLWSLWFPIKILITEYAAELFKCLMSYNYENITIGFK